MKIDKPVYIDALIKHLNINFVETKPSIHDAIYNVAYAVSCVICFAGFLFMVLAILHYVFINSGNCFFNPANCNSCF